MKRDSSPEEGSSWYVTKIFERISVLNVQSCITQVGNNISLADIHLYFFCSEYTTPPMLTATPKVPH